MKFYEGKKTSFEHDINCAPGDSSAPVYRDYGDDWVVRGIHSDGFIGQGGVAKTIDSNVLNLIKKHEQ